MKTKHTPGPWYTYQLGDGMRVIRQAGDDYLVASTMPSAYESVAEANARLIAAAPDLMESLRSLISTHNLSALDKGIGTATKSGMAWLAARAAIAKATGDQP